MPRRRGSAEAARISQQVHGQGQAPAQFVGDRCDDAVAVQLVSGLGDVWHRAAHRRAAEGAALVTSRGSEANT